MMVARQRTHFNSPSPNNRTNEILYIDARNEGHLINRRTKELSEEDIQKIVQTYHNWKGCGDDLGKKWFAFSKMDIGAVGMLEKLK
jgi:type I restriction enzyme M protein